MVFYVQYLPPWTHMFFIYNPRLVSQAGRRGFESRLPLHCFSMTDKEASNPECEFDRLSCLLAEWNGVPSSRGADFRRVSSSECQPVTLAVAQGQDHAAKPSPQVSGTVAGTHQARNGLLVDTALSRYYRLREIMKMKARYDDSQNDA